MHNERFFTDFTEETLRTFWEKSSSMQIFDTWLSMDVRSDRENVQWINLLAKRVLKLISPITVTYLSRKHDAIPRFRNASVR